MASFAAPTADEPPKKGPLLEYSVVYTDRAYNLMSAPFCEAMRDINAALKRVYNAHSVAIIPGSGSYAMEAVARQFATGKKVIVLRNGYFSFRWSDIFQVCGIPAEEIVLKAQPVGKCTRHEAGADPLAATPQFQPYPIAEACARIRAEKPAVVFAPHVETATGMLLPDAYLKAIGDAVREGGGLFVLDCIASGNVWVDMQACGVDALISAPQKGWTGPACAGLVMLGERARAAADDPANASTSFCCNLGKWLTVMDKYAAGGFMYYTTLPTDALMTFRDVIKETEAYGFDRVRGDMLALGAKVRAVLAERGFKSVAADGFAAPGVVVSYVADPATQGGAMVGAFKAQGLQIAGGVPFKLDHEVDSRRLCFRLGLFGLDKMQHVDRTVEKFRAALDAIVATSTAK